MPLVILKMRAFLDLIKFEHTIFALPFAYLGMLLAARGWPGWDKFIWITVAMAAARTLAMRATRALPNARWSPAKFRCAPPGPAAWYPCSF